MTMATATLITENAPGYAPGTNFYRTSDGKYLLVEVMPAPEQATHYIELGQSPQNDDLLAVLGTSFAALKVVVRPTVVLLANADGVAIDSDENDNDPMTPIAVFPAGTTHEDALAAMGHTLNP